MRPNRGASVQHAARGLEISRGLIVLKEHLDKILRGTKTVEIRKKSARVRGPIALIEAGSGTVVGTCRLVGSIGPMTLEQRRKIARRAGFSQGDIPAPRRHAWILAGARRIAKPCPYRHPRGAQVWVKLGTTVAQEDAAPLTEFVLATEGTLR